MMKSEEKLEEVRNFVKSWIAKQGHDSCWYYPEIFKEIANALEIQVRQPSLPCRKEFELGCCKYQEEIYKESNHGNSHSK